MAERMSGRKRERERETVAERERERKGGGVCFNHTLQHIFRLDRVILAPLPIDHYSYIAH